MTTYESKLTAANIKQITGRQHIYITSFLRELPKDVFGGTGKYDLAPRSVRLEFGMLVTDTFVPTERSGKPRYFFQDREFVGEFFRRTDAQPGETVLFEQVTPYHYRLSLRKLDGTIRSA
jgi:hypothetical protein